MKKRALIIGLNPVIQKTLLLDQFIENEVNRTDTYFLSIAGKGANTARVFTQLGGEGIHLTHSGGIFDQLFRSMLDQDHINFAAVPSGSEIRYCYTLLNKERNTSTEIVEEAYPVSDKTDQLMREKFLMLLPNIDIITICGSKADGYGSDIIPWMTAKAAQSAKEVILDVRGEDLRTSIPHKPAIVTPNLKEFVETFFPGQNILEHDATDGAMLDEVKAQMAELYTAYGTSSVITRGVKPVLYCSQGTVQEMEIPSVDPVNTIGSGDAFNGGLTYGISMSHSLEASVQTACTCGMKNALSLLPGSINPRHSL